MWPIVVLDDATAESSAGESSFDCIEISVCCCPPLYLVKLRCLRLLFCLLVNNLSDDTRLASLTSCLIQGNMAISPECQCTFDLIWNQVIIVLILVGKECYASRWKSKSDIGIYRIIEAWPADYSNCAINIVEMVAKVWMTKGPRKMFFWTTFDRMYQ